MQEADSKIIAFIFLILSISSLAFNHHFEALNIIAQIASNVLILLCLIWTLPVIYKAIPIQKFIVSSALLTLGVVVYQVEIWWSDTPTLVTSIVTLLIAFSLSNFTFSSMRSKQQS